MLTGSVNTHVCHIFAACDSPDSDRGGETGGDRIWKLAGGLG